MVTSDTTSSAVVLKIVACKSMLARLLRMSSSQWVGPVAMLNVPGKHKNLQPDSDGDIISITIVIISSTLLTLQCIETS